MLDTIMRQVISATLKELQKFTHMEMYYRDYYRMEQGLDFYSEAEKRKFLEKYHDNRFITQDSCVDRLDNSFFPPDCDISITKHCRYLPGRPHTHSFIELFYILEGNCIQICNQKRYNLKAGDFCFWEFDAPHSISSNQDQFFALNIAIKRERFENLFFPLLKTQNILSYYFQNILYGHSSQSMIIFRTGGDPNVLYNVSRMFQEHLNKSDYYIEMITTCLNETLIYLLRTHLTNVISTTTGKDNQAASILQYIQDQYRTVTLQDVCAHFNYTPSYLSRLIKKSFGMTFSEMIRKLRMQRAKWLLENTRLPVLDIALEAGCSDSSHLNRLFRQEYQIAPLKCRQDFHSSETV